MLTSHDLPALLEALRERQPRAGWVEGSQGVRDRTAAIPGSVFFVLPTPENAEYHYDFGAPDLCILGQMVYVDVAPEAPVDAFADAICDTIRRHLAARIAHLNNSLAALEALRDATEPDPLENVTAEAMTRAAAALTPPDAAEVKWRAVPLVGVSAAALLIHHGSPHKVADALRVVTGLDVKVGDHLSIKGTHTQALRAGEALAALSSIAESMIRCREDATP